jgi:hypothetical protein
LPGEVVREIRWLGKEILERRTLDLFHLAVSTVAGIEIVLEKRAEVDLFKRIFLLGSGDRILFGRCSGGAFPVFLFLAYFVEQGNGILKLLKDRVLHHLSVDHVLQLKLVEREDRDHLHQAWGQDLALR